MEMPSPVEIFGSYVAWKMNPETWIINFMNGSENMYLLEGTEKALLIDTGWGAGNLRAFVESLTDKPLYVANTHFHPDHAAGNGEFERVYMSAGAEKDLYSVEKKNPGLAPFDISKLPHPDYEKVFVGDGFTFDLGGRTVEVIDTKPAHCNSSLFYLDRKYRLFFTGDELEAGQVNLFNNSENPDLPYDQEEVYDNFLSNMQRIKEVEDAFDFLMPNHNGSPLSKEYTDDFIALINAIFDGTATICEKLEHKYMEMDPQADKICRVRHGKVSIMTYRDEVERLYGSRR